MKVLLVSGILFLATYVAAQGTFGGRGNENPGFLRRGPRPIYANCGEFDRAVSENIEENRLNGEGGPSRCQSRNLEECRVIEQMKTRLDLTEDLRQQCLEHVDQYLKCKPSSGFEMPTDVESLFARLMLM